MKKTLLPILILTIFNLSSVAQVTVKGLITEANTNPASGVVKKPLPGVQIKAWGAVATDVSDNSGGFRLVFERKTPGDSIKGVTFEKTGYEIFNPDVIDSWTVSSDPNRIEKIKMCPAGTIARVSNENYQNLYNALLAQYNKQKQELNKLKISDEALSDTLKDLEKRFRTQEIQLQNYALRFARIDFDDVSELYRNAYTLFSQGKLDSVAVVLEEADLLARTDLRLQERSRIDKMQAEAIAQEQQNEAGIKEDMEAIKMLAQTYTMKFEYEKATPLYERLVQLDSSNIEFLYELAVNLEYKGKYEPAKNLCLLIIQEPKAKGEIRGETNLLLGSINYDQGNYNDALFNFSLSHEVFKNLKKEYPESQTFTHSLCVSAFYSGEIYLKKYDFKNAILFFKEEIELVYDLLKSNYQNEDNWIEKNMVIDYLKLSELHLLIGDLGEASKYSNFFLQKRKELQDILSSDIIFLKRLARQFNKLSKIHQTIGKYDLALKNTLEECNIYQQLYNIRKYSSTCLQLSHGYERLGNLYERMGNYEEALKQYEIENELLKKFLENDPTDEIFCGALADSYVAIAELHEMQGKFVETRHNYEKARKHYENCILLQEKLLQDNVTNDDIIYIKSDLADSYESLGAIFEAMNNKEEALKYYEKFNGLMRELNKVVYDENGDRFDSEFYQNMKLDLATSYEKLGDIKKAIGYTVEALKYFEENLKIIEDLYITSPKNETNKLKLISAYWFLGNEHEDNHSPTEALKYYEKELELRREYIDLNPCNQQEKQYLANNYSRMGSIQWGEGRLEIALGYYLQSLKLREELFKSKSQVEDVIEGLTLDYGALGGIYEDMGLPEEALKYYENELTLTKELYEANPRNESYKNDLAISYKALCTIQQTLGHMEEALKYCREYQRLAVELCISNPKSEELKRSLATSFSEIGNVQYMQGHLEEALKNFEECNQSIDELYKDNPCSEDIKKNLAISYSKMGSIHQDMGHMEQALKYFEKNNRLIKEIFEDNPSNESLKNGLAVSYEEIGSINQNMGNMEEALKYFEKYNKLMKELYEDNPSNLYLKYNLSVSHQRLGYIYQEKGHLEEALKYFESDLALAKELYEASPQSELYKNGLAGSFSKLGSIHLEMGHKEEALKNYEENIRLMKELNEARPQNKSLKNGLAGSYSKLGSIHLEMGRKEEALKNFEINLKIAEELHKSDPQSENKKITLAIAIYQMGIIYSNIGNKEEALKSYIYLNKIAIELHNANPKNEYLKHGLALSYGELGVIHQAMENFNEAQEYYFNFHRLIKELCESNPLKESLKRDLATSYSKLGDIHLVLGMMDEALNYFQKDMELSKELFALNPASIYNVKLFVNAYGYFSRYSLFNGQFSNSEKSSRSGLDLALKHQMDSTALWINTNLAHALLFQGKYEEAKAIYLKYKDQSYPLDPEKTFGELFLKDLDELEKAGITHPDVAKIRKLLTE